MCIGGGGGQRQVAKYKKRDDAAIVTGEQIDVENPKDTKKVTEELKIKRQQRDNIYKNPNTIIGEKLAGKRLTGKNPLGF
jgi:hypothetical protein